MRSLFNVLVGCRYGLDNFYICNYCDFHYFGIHIGFIRHIFKYIFAFSMPMVYFCIKQKSMVSILKAIP